MRNLAPNLIKSTKNKPFLALGFERYNLNKLQMSVSILECLQNARYNLDNAIKMPMLMPMVKEQLNNAVELLDKGYGIWDEVEPLLEKYGDIDSVPEKENIEA